MKKNFLYTLVLVSVFAAMQICAQTVPVNTMPVQSAAPGFASPQMAPHTMSTDADDMANSNGAAAKKEPPPPNPNLSMLPELDPIEGKIYANFMEKYWTWILGPSLLSAAILYIIFKPKQKVPPTPYEIAILSLAKTNSKKDELSAKQYADEISRCVRNYIEGAHQIPAPARTTEEFLRIATRALIFDKKQRTQLEQILKLADMAKFAMHSFKENERDEIYATAYEFVQNDNKKIELIKKIDNETPTPAEQIPTDTKSEKIELSDGDK